MSIDVLDYIANTCFVAEEIDGTIYYRSIEEIDCLHKDENIKSEFILGRERLSFDFKEVEGGFIIRVLSDNAEGKEQKYTCEQILSKPRVFEFLPGLKPKMFSYYRDQLKDRKIKIFTVLDNLKKIDLVGLIEDETCRICTYQIETIYNNKPVSGKLILFNVHHNYDKKHTYIFISGDIYIAFNVTKDDDDERKAEHRCLVKYIEHHPLLKGILF